MTFVVLCGRIGCSAACTMVVVSNVYAGCTPGGLQLTPAVINDFLKRPEAILNQDASSKRGARELSVSVSRYAAADPAIIHALKPILPKASLQQRKAIGEGLYTAAAFCKVMDQAVATKIESGVKSIEDKDVTQAYLLAARTADPSTGKAQPQNLTGLTSAKPLTRQPGLIGEPTPTNPGSLKLSDPFGPLGNRR